MKRIANLINSTNMKKGLCVIGNFAKESCEVIAPIVGLMLASKLTNAAVDVSNFNRKVGYSDAVEAITNSFMCSDDKAKAVSTLRRDGNSEFYKAVINITDSFMCSDDKLKAIQNMSEDQ